MATVQVWLSAVTVRTEHNRVHVNPSRIRCPQFNPYRKPVRLGRVAELMQYPQAGIQIIRVDGQVQVTVLSGLPPDKRDDSPAASHPVANFGTIECLQDLDHVFDAHASS